MENRSSIILLAMVAVVAIVGICVMILNSVIASNFILNHSNISSAGPKGYLSRDDEYGNAIAISSFVDPREFFLEKGESVVIFGKVITLIDVVPDGSRAILLVNDVNSSFGFNQSRFVSGIKINMDNIYLSENNTSQGAAIITVWNRKNVYSN